MVEIRWTVEIRCLYLVTSTMLTAVIETMMMAPAEEDMRVTTCNVLFL